MLEIITKRAFTAEDAPLEDLTVSLVGTVPSAVGPILGTPATTGCLLHIPVGQNFYELFISWANDGKVWKRVRRSGVTGEWFPVGS